MTNLTLKQLTYFDALARLGHFGRAAEACAISQPALSMQIKDLELGLGASLFERSGRKIALTGFGEVFSERVRDILRSVEELEALAARLAQHAGGALRIGVSPRSRRILLPRVVANLTRLWGTPELDIRLRESITPTLIRELAEGRLDAAIVGAGLSPSRGSRRSRCSPSGSCSCAPTPSATSRFLLRSGSRR